MPKPVDPVEPEEPQKVDPFESGDDSDVSPEGEKEEEHEGDESDTSWIEISLVDEANEPVAGARFKIKLSNGRFLRGSLDENGFARVEKIPPGTCQVTFPSLDEEAWERL